MIKGILVAPLITIGRIRLSTQLITSIPQSAKPIPSTVCPWLNNQIDTAPQTNGVPKGIKAMIKVTMVSKIGLGAPAK